MRIREDLRHQLELVLARVAALEAELARTQATLQVALARRESRIVELDAQVVELTVELPQRKKGFRPKANAISRPKRDQDGRARGERKPPGVVRPPVDPRPEDIVHDLRNEVCLDCGGTLEDTGEFDEHTVEDLPPLMTLRPDALALGHTRSTLAASEFAAARQRIENRLDTLISTRSTDKDCRWINLRLVKHRCDLLRFLEVAGVPPDHNLGERDIRSVAAAPIELSHGRWRR